MKCDGKFAVDILVTCTEGLPIPAVCLVPAIVYGAGVIIFGGEAYNNSRRRR